MKNRITIVLLTALTLLVFGTGLLSAQVKIDVKTKWNEKKELTLLKRGVLQALDLSVEFEDVEFGEDYALWLRDVERSRGEGDTVIVALAFDVREGSLFQEGELISSGQVILRYNSRTLDSVGNDLNVRQRARTYRENYELINTLIAETATTLIPKGKLLAGSIVSLLLSELNEPPELPQIYEGVLVGVQVVLALEEMM